MFQVRTDPIRAGRTFWRMLRGADHSLPPHFKPSYLEGEHLAVLAKRPGVSQAGKESDRIRNQTEAQICVSEHKVNFITFNAYSKNLGLRKVEKMPQVQYFLFLCKPRGTGRLTCGLLRLTLKWPLKANTPVKLLCKLKWLDIPGHHGREKAVLMTAWHLEVASTSDQKGDGYKSSLILHKGSDKIL